MPQGFASGDCERDAQAINIFMDDGHVLGCSQSYAKNMGLYGQRIGCFSIVTEDPQEAVKVESQMKVRTALQPCCAFLFIMLHGHFSQARVWCAARVSSIARMTVQGRHGFLARAVLRCAALCCALSARDLTLQSSAAEH